MKKKLFSVSIEDCKVETIKGSGPGGQNRNKRETCVRITHPPSGAVGLGTEERTQFANKKAAFVRMAKTKEFNNWLKLQAAKMQGYDPEAEVEKMMQAKNLKIETRNEEGNWVDYPSSE